jgi:hypothetical protein
MEINPLAEQGTSDIAALVAGAPGTSNLDIQVETVVAPVRPMDGEYQLEPRAELQFDNPEAVEADIKEYVGDAATDDTVVLPPELVVPDFMKDHPLATAPQQELMRVAFTQMFPTICGPRADTRAAYQHGKLSQMGPVVDIGRGLKGPRQFKVHVDALPRQINKKGQATRVKLFAPNVVGLVPA